MTETYGNLIDGKWRPARSGKTFDDLNPADTPTWWAAVPHRTPTT